MFYSGLLTDRKDMDVREAAALRQQRRMKQAVQFNHKDSADLLPLDGLKKLGTSKDTRRLMETNMSRLRHSRGTCSQKNDLSAQTNKLNQIKLDSPPKTEEEDLILICCQCNGKELQVVVNTGCQRNIISSACLERLGLKEHMKTCKAEGEKISLPHNMKAIGHLEHLPLIMGTVHVDCSAVVVAELKIAKLPLFRWYSDGTSQEDVLDIQWRGGIGKKDNEKSFSLGIQTLKYLKCVINLEKQNLILGKTDKEEIPFVNNASIHEEKAHPHGSHLRSWFSAVAHNWKPGKCPWKSSADA